MKFSICVTGLSWHLCNVKGERGFVLLWTFILMIGLIFFASALGYYISHETKDVGFQYEDTKLLYLAEAGIERAMREIRDDYLTSTLTGIAEIRGDDTSGSSSVNNDDRMRYEEDANAVINASTDVALLKDFDKNYSNTRIVKVELGILANRANGGTGATIEVSYATDGTYPNSNTKLTQALTTTATRYHQDVTADRSWDWVAVMGANFSLRAVRTAGNRDINLDYLYLRVTYEIDTETEPWHTGTYQSYPLSLGGGTVESVMISDEQGKVHLNTASQSLLRYLMVENGIDDTTANTVATNIVNYRSTNEFDSIEELQQVSGVTSSIYSAIDQDITVYSYINTYAQGPAGARAPININTASQAVLQAVLDPLTFDNASDITNLASDIITQRGTSPFTSFYSSDTGVTTDFFDFVRSRSYLSDAEDDRVLGNADASSLVPREGGNNEAALTTEFSYDTGVFKVESVGKYNNRSYRVATFLGQDGAKTFTTFSGDTTAAGYRKENFE